MSDNISVSSESGAELEVIIPPTAPPLSPEIMELPFPNQLSGMIANEWDEAVLLPTWIDDAPDTPEQQDTPPGMVESTSEADSASDSQYDKIQDDDDDDDDSNGDRDRKSVSDYESDELSRHTSDRPLEALLGAPLEEMSARIASMEREKREIEAAAEERVKRYQRESEELQLALSALRSESEQRHKLSQLSETDLISMVQRKDREISFLSEEAEKYTKRLSELSIAKLSEQSQLEKALKEDERLRLRESAMEQQREFASKKSEWLEEELTQKSKDAIQMKSRLQEQICALEEDNIRNVKQLDELRIEFNQETEEKEKLRCRLDTCLSDLESSRDERCIIEDRHRQEVAGQKRLASLYKESAEQSELKVSELLGRAEQLQKAVTDREQSLRETELRISEEHAQIFSQREALQSRVGELETELRHANEMFEKAGVGRRGLFQCEGKTETITEIYSKYVEATNYIQDLEEVNARVKLNLETYKNSVNEKIPLMRRQKEENDYLKRNNKEIHEHLERLSSQLESLTSESDISIRRSRFLERENLKQCSTIRELNTQVCVLLKESEESRGMSISSFSLPADLTDPEVSSSSEGRVISFRSLEELQARNVELMSKVREVEAELEQMKGVGQDERIRDTQKKVAELTVVVEQVKESKRQQSEMIQSVIRDRDRYKSLLAQSTALPRESTFINQTTEQTTELVELQNLFDNHKRQSEDIRKQLVRELGEVKEAKSHLELETDRLDSKLEFASERQELLKNWYESQRTESQTLREKNEQLLKHMSDMEQSARNMMQDQFQTRDQLSRLEFQKESLEKKNEALKTSEEWSKNQIEVLLREKRDQNLLKANIEMIQNSLERTEHENKLRTTQQVGLLEEELRNTRTQLEQKGKQHERVVEAWEKQVDELKTSLHTTHETQILNVNLSNNQTAKIRDLESVLASSQKKVEQRERDLAEARDNLKKAESGAIVMDLQEESSRMKLRVAELEQKCKAMETRVSRANEHVEHYKNISEAAEHQIKENLETSEIFRTDMESKLSERDERESELKFDVSGLERECRELRESLKQLETAHATTLSNREIDVQYTKNLLKEAQANLALLEGKEAMAREDVLLHERVSQETQDKYEREIIEHGKTVEVLCRSKDELSAIKLKLQAAEQEATQHLFKLEEGKQNWNDLNQIGESRIEQLTAQLTDAQSQNKLLFSQLESINARLITLQSDRDSSILSTTEETHHTASLLTSEESENQLRELIRHIRREKEIVETKFELAESERVRLSEICKRYESELEETRTALAGEQEALRAQAETVAQHSQLLEKVNTLNLLQESNRVLREDRNSFEKKSNSLSTQLKDKVEDLFSVKESNKTLTSQKETLLAEKTALKNEVARWQARVNHLLEVYDKMDPEEFRELQSLKDEHLTKISDLTDRVKLMDDERNEQKHRTKLLEDRLSQLQSESESTQDKHATALREVSDKLSVKEEDLRVKSENSKRFAQAARNWKTRFEEKNTKFQEIEKNLNELKTSNLQEKSRSEEEWQERQQELTEKNQGLEIEKTNIQQQLNETKAALEEKSRKVERMQDGLKKLNIRVRQQTKTLEEKVSTMKTENAQLKTANAEKEGQLQALKNQHQSQLSLLEAKFKLESSSKVSSTQPSPCHASIAPSKQVAAIKPSKLSITANPTTVVVNPILRDQISVSISPFTSSLVTSSAQPSSSLPPTIPTVSSDWSKYPSGSGYPLATNFNLSQVQLDLQAGVTTRSGSKRRREEAATEAAEVASTSDPLGKKNKVLTTPPLDSSQLPTSLADGTSVIDSSTTHSHSPNSTYGNPPPVIEESISSHLQVVPSSMDDLLQPSAIYCELSPSNPASARSPPRLLLPPSFENFGEIEHAVPNTPILQPGNPISGHSSIGHSVPVPPDSSSINIASDEGLTNDHELDFDIGHDIIHTHSNTSQEDNLYGEFRGRSVDVNIASPTRNLPFSSNADSPSSTPGPQVSTSTHNQNSSVSTRQEDPLGTDEIMLPETSEIPLLQTESEEPTSAADVISRIELPEPTEGVSCIEIPHELSYDQLSSSDEEALDREEHTTVVSSDDSESEVPFVIDEFDSREAKKGGSVESVSEGEIDDQLHPDIEIIDPSEPSGSLPESSSKTTREPRYVPITWGGTPPVTQSKRRGMIPPDTLPPTTSKGTGHKGMKLPPKRPTK